LQSLGYTNVRHYRGGIADWTAHHGLVAGVPAHEPTHQDRTRPSPKPQAFQRSQDFAPRHDRSIRLIDALGDCSIGKLLLLWLGMIVGFGLVYWSASAWGGHGLRAGTVPLGMTWEGLATAVYFSFVTALSIGYGDIIPVGLMRILAIAEGAGGLLIFGCVISKLVSRRQEELIEEIHRIAFEDRLGRVRTNLHLVLSDLQVIAGMCADPNVGPERILPRVESAATVFAGELQAIHDLLYRPQQIPDEQVLEAILANLAAGLQELNDLLNCLSEAPQRSATFQMTLRSMTALANEICSECVPRTYAPALTGWMDRIQELARRIV